MTAGYGIPFATLSKSSNQNMLWLKTSEDCSVQKLLPVAGGECWEEYLETWTTWGTMRNGVAYRHAPSIFRISEKDCSLLRQTPQAADANKLMPTPTATEYGSNQGGAAGRVGPVRHSLGSSAKKGLLPTPASRDYRSDSSKQTDKELYGTSLDTHNTVRTQDGHSTNAPVKERNESETFIHQKHI